MTSIFIVEDNNDLRYIYEKSLILYGFNVIGSAKNGKEAVAMFKKFAPKPDVTIMDY